MIDKKDEILNAAYTHFARRGYHVSMSDIAKAVNIKTPSLYSHFPSKDEILLTAISREVEKYRTFLDQIYNRVQKNPKEPLNIDHLHTIFLQILTYFNENDKLRFWRHILLIDAEDLRKTCSALVFDLEMYHIQRLSAIFKSSAKSTIDPTGESQAIHFIAMLQSALEIELLFYESQEQAQGYISKLWLSYSAQSSGGN